MLVTKRPDGTAVETGDVLAPGIVFLRPYSARPHGRIVIGSRAGITTCSDEFYNLTTMHVVCAWCPNGNPAPLDELVSHTICPPCAEALV